MSDKVKKDFVRRIKGNGIYTGWAGKKKIVIKDRAIYQTDDPKEITFLEADPEIEPLEDRTGKDDEDKDTGEFSPDELKKEIKKRGIALTGDEQKNDLIKIIKDDDKSKET